MAPPIRGMKCSVQHWEPNGWSLLSNLAVDIIHRAHVYHITRPTQSCVTTTADWLQPTTSIPLTCTTFAPQARTTVCMFFTIFLCVWKDAITLLLSLQNQLPPLFSTTPIYYKSNKKLSWCWQTRTTHLEVNQSRSPNIAPFHMLVYF